MTFSVYNLFYLVARWPYMGIEHNIMSNSRQIKYYNI